MMIRGQPGGVEPLGDSDGPSSSMTFLEGDMGEETKFNDLTTVVKEKIFSFLDPFDLQLVRTVCSNWFYLINNKWGIRGVIDNRNTELLVLSPWIVNVQLLSLTRPLPPTGLSFGLRLREVYFRGIIVSYNLIPLLQSCPHLQSITFDDPTIDLPLDIMRSLTPLDLSLPSCTHLEFLCWNLTESLNTILSILSLIQFGSLTEIVLRSVHPPMLPLGLIFAPFPRPLPANTTPLMALILKNLASLTRLSVGTLVVQNEFIFLQGSGETGGNVVQLQELHLHNLYLSWTSILENQGNLEVLSIGHCQAQQWAEIRTSITRCQGSLRKVELQGRTFGVPWENDVFGECEHLEELHMNLSLSPKRLLSQLPTSLQELAIDGPIELQEIGQLRHLTSLKKLQLNSLGLNLLILFPGNPEEGEEVTEVIRLGLFLDLLLSLTSLQVFQFKDCAQDALDWVRINGFCRQVTSETPGMTFQDHFYDVHGQLIQHGLTLKIPSEFNRSELRIPADGGEGGLSSGGLQSVGFIGNVLRMFGL